MSKQLNRVVFGDCFGFRLEPKPFDIEKELYEQSVSDHHIKIAQKRTRAKDTILQTPEGTPEIWVFCSGSLRFFGSPIDKNR